MSTAWLHGYFAMIQFLPVIVLTSPAAYVTQLLETLNGKNGTVSPPCSIAILPIGRDMETYIRNTCSNTWPMGRPLWWKIPQNHSVSPFAFLEQYLNGRSLSNNIDHLWQPQWCPLPEGGDAAMHKLPTVINGLTIYALNSTENWENIGIVYRDHKSSNVSTLVHKISQDQITSPEGGVFFRNDTILKFILKISRRKKLDKIYIGHSPLTGIFYMDSRGKLLLPGSRETNYRVLLCEHENVNDFCEKSELRGMARGSYKFCTKCKFNLKGRNCQLDPNECKEQTYEQVVSYHYLECDGNWTTGKATPSENVTVMHGGHKCSKNGICINKFPSYKCQCNEGWYGDLCDFECTESQHSCGRHAAYCLQTPGSFECVCQRGYTGKYCETDIDECVNNPCNNNGSCINKEGTYSCNCIPGFTGMNCSEDVDECLQKPCINWEVCLNNYGSYSCKCPVGFTGQNCSTDIDECNENPCSIGSSCLNTNGSYSCICASGLTEKDCSQSLNGCNNFTCMNNGTCLDTNGSYSCICEIGFTGQNCSQGLDEGSDQPCNGTTCLNMNATYQRFAGRNCSEDNGTTPLSEEGFPRICPTGYTGKNCSESKHMNLDSLIELADEKLPVLNERHDFTCMNNGTRLGNNGNYSCICEVGYTGQNCSQDLNECSDHPCKEGATCVNENGTYYCICPAGFTGKNCAEDVHKRLPVPSAATPLSKESFLHTCPTGYTGQNCSENLNGCHAFTCMNNGTCLENNGSYSCACEAGFTGQNCSYDIDECNYHPCNKEATCMNTNGGYYCTCPPGFTGRNCFEVSVATLSSKESSPHICPAGYTGQNCSENVTKPLPVHKVTTVSSKESFPRKCPTGYTGRNCSDPADECQRSPCENGGTCKYHEDGYTCECAPGYTGQNCTEDIDECLNNPCMNGGTCNNNHGSYICVCSAEYTGHHCNSAAISAKDYQYDSSYLIWGQTVIALLALVVIIAASILLFQHRADRKREQKAPISTNGKQSTALLGDSRIVELPIVLSNPEPTSVSLESGDSSDSTTIEDDAS